MVCVFDVMTFDNEGGYASKIAACFGRGTTGALIGMHWDIALDPQVGKGGIRKLVLSWGVLSFRGCHVWAFS